jgi:hypothetical protein
MSSTMRIHRNPRQRFFTTLGNEVLRDSRLSFCARGILGHLLSLPDGQRVDIRTLAERTPEGRERVASALRELQRYGYMRRTVRRGQAGQFYTDVEVFDRAAGDGSAREHSRELAQGRAQGQGQGQGQGHARMQTRAKSQVALEAGFPGFGGPGVTVDDDQPGKERVEETTHPAAAAKSLTAAATASGAVTATVVTAATEVTAVASGEEGEPGRAGADVEETVRSVAVPARASRAEPRLSLGQIEAFALAPLVTEWRRRGASDLHIIGTLTAGLPAAVHCPAALVRDRLRRKMPAERVEIRVRSECSECAAPIAVAGRCAGCQEPETARGARTARAARTGDVSTACSRGVALVRAALRGGPSTAAGCA